MGSVNVLEVTSLNHLGREQALQVSAFLFFLCNQFGVPISRPKHYVT